MVLHKIRNVFRSITLFVRSEQAGGIVLAVVTVLAFILANSPLEKTVVHFFEQPLVFSLGSFRLEKELLHWINDGLMTIFFLLVGLEIKLEIVEGELSSFRNAILPVTAALGGMLVPALIYAVFNIGTGYVAGWGIPTATDIAFSLAVINVLGKKVPMGLKVFLAALAIADDLGAVLVLAVFYSQQVQFVYLGYAGLVLLGLLLLNWLYVQKTLPYYLLGLVLWFCMLKSGVHATVAGVLLAMVVPSDTKITSSHLLDWFDRRLHQLREIMGRRKIEAGQIAEELNRIYIKTISPGQRMQVGLHTLNSFLILPLFAFANTLISLEPSSFHFTTASYGIMFGLLLGKPLGILLFSWLTIRIGLGILPNNVTWKHMLGAGILAGIGFTMSIFISTLVFAGEELEQAKLSILLASVLAAIAGYLYLQRICTQIVVNDGNDLVEEE